MQDKKCQTSFHWRLNNSNLLKHNPYNSELFKCEMNDINSEWKIRLELTNDWSTTRSAPTEKPYNICLILCMIDEPAIKAKCKISITFNSPTCPTIVESFTREWFFVQDVRALRSRKIPVLLDNNAIETKSCNYLITCEITVEAGSLGYIDHAQNTDLLARNLMSLLSNEECSDVVLVSRDEQKFRVHRCILVARSPVFAAMFTPCWSESQEGTVKIDDINGEHLRRLLDYVYGGKFMDNEKDGIEVASGLLIAADKYGFNKLKAKCADALGSQLSADNVMEVFALADAHGVKRLKEQIMDFIVNCPDVINSCEFLMAEKQNPQLVIQILRRKWRRKV